MKDKVISIILIGVIVFILVQWKSNVSEVQTISYSENNTKDSVKIIKKNEIHPLDSLRYKFI